MLHSTYLRMLRDCVAASTLSCSDGFLSFRLAFFFAALVIGFFDASAGQVGTQRCRTLDIPASGM